MKAPLALTPTIQRKPINMVKNAKVKAKSIFLFSKNMITIQHSQEIKIIKTEGAITIKEL